MTGITEQYNEFFCNNYNMLVGFAKSINVKADYESLLHDCYIKCAVRISGFTGATTGFLNFTRVVIMNLYKTRYRDKKHTIFIDEVQEEVEQQLLEEQQHHDSRKQYDNEMQFLNTMAHEFINEFYDEREAMVFRTYYVLKHKHLNYKQLSLATNMSITTVSNIIKKQKKDLRDNLLSYINTGKRNDDRTTDS